MVDLVELVYLVVLVGVVDLQVAQVHLDKDFLVEVVLGRRVAVEEGRVQPVQLVGWI